MAETPSNPPTYNPPPFNPLRQKLEQYQRERAIADQLVKQGSTPLQSTTSGTGNHPVVVAPSKFQVFSQIAQALGGSYLQNKANQNYEDIAKEMQQRQEEAIKALGDSKDPATTASAANSASQYGVDPEVVKALVTRNLKKPEPYTLGQGQQRFDENNQSVATVAPKPEKTPGEIGPVSPGDFTPESIAKYNETHNFADLKRTYAPTTQNNVSVNTDKSLYGTINENEGKAIADLHVQAQNAPALIERSQRIRDLLKTGDAITGAGANQVLAMSKVAAQLGFNTGDAAADTEALGADLARGTLDNIKSSGLGGGSGFSNADRDFLEKAAGGKITLEGKTLARLADLNERSARATIKRYNDTRRRLKPDLIPTFEDIQQPAGPAAQGPSLQKNPDGSFNYVPAGH